MEQFFETAANIALVLGGLGAILTLLYHLKQGKGTRTSRLEDKIDTANRDLGDRVDGVDQRLNQKLDTVNRDLGDRVDGVNQNLDRRIEGISTQLTSINKELSSIVHSQTTMAGIVQATVPEDQKEIVEKVLFRVVS